MAGFGRNVLTRIICSAIKKAFEYQVLEVSSHMRFGFPIPSKSVQTAVCDWAVIPCGDLPNFLISDENSSSKESRTPAQHASGMNARVGASHVQSSVLGAAG